MDHYIDIRLRPDPEFSVPMLMGALYGKLHRALVRMKAEEIGVSFPRFTLRPKCLGDVLRLHGSSATLNGLMAQPWLSGMLDHIERSEVAEVPADARHRIVRRRQFKTNAERLRRRRANRHGETMEQARMQIPAAVERKISLPFVQIASSTTGQRFSLFIEHGQVQDSPIAGTFNSYGLGQEATVPWF